MRSYLYQIEPSFVQFYAILTEINKDGASETEPEVAKENGKPVKQYPPPSESW